jgi:hypothetical protein
LSVLETDIIEMKLNIILSSLTFRYTRHVEFLKLVPERLTSEHLRISEKIKIVNEKGLNPDSDMKFFETDNEDLINATREAEVSKRVESVMQALKKANSDILKQMEFKLKEKAKIAVTGSKIEIVDE